MAILTLDDGKKKVVSGITITDPVTGDNSTVDTYNALKVAVSSNTEAQKELMEKFELMLKELSEIKYILKEMGE